MEACPFAEFGRAGVRSVYATAADRDPEACAARTGSHLLTLRLARRPNVKLKCYHAAKSV